MIFRLVSVIGRIYANQSRLEKSFKDIQEGRKSYSRAESIEVSRMDSIRGGLFMIDGHHRILEYLMEGKKSLEVRICKDIPYIERTGGSYDSLMFPSIQVKAWRKTHE